MNFKRQIVTLLFILSFMFQTQAEGGWEEAVKRVENSIGLIEYYEQIVSTEAIEEKSRVKKRLTGILVDPSGLMLTSSSIFKAQLEFTSSSIFSKARLPEDITVRFPDKDPIPAEFVGKDDDKGLAFIQLKEQTDIQPATFHEDTELRIGQKILILQHLGSIYNYELVINERTVNAVIPVPHKRYLCENQLSTLSNFGLVTNSEGEGLGVLMASDHSSGSGRFDFLDREANTLAEILSFESFDSLIRKPPVYREKETTRKKWLGINMQPFTRDMAKYYKVPDLKGVLVNTILEGSPAARAGLRVGDVITAIEDQKVEAEKDNDLQIFRNLIREQKDDMVTFRIFRDKQYQDLTIELSDIPFGQFLAEEVTNTSLGFSVKELTKDIILAKQLDFDTQGVWVSRVENASWADIAGLSIGDLILELDHKIISGLSEIESCFSEIEQEKPEYVSLFIERRSETRFLFIKTNYEE